MLTLTFSCKKEAPKVIPTLITATISNITSTTATGGGSITNDGGAAVTVRGVCWSLNQSPTTLNSKTSDGAGIGNFTSSITGLTPGATYYLRAYATNSVGIAYGSQLTLLALANLPVITTTAITALTSTTATSGGNITSDGGAAVTAKGVCWSTNQNPITTDNKTSDGIGTGIFTSSIINLIPGTTYYFRAYAVNSAGTAYGSQVVSTTMATTPVITTTALTNITSSTAISGGFISFDGGSSITERGVCWSTIQNPTIVDNKTMNGMGSSSFISTITGLSPGTKYYIRSYATNSMGTAYGDQLIFTTLAIAPTIITLSLTPYTETTATGGGNVTNDGGANVTSRGVCWSTNHNPTILNNKTLNGTGLGIFTSSIIELSSNTTYYVRAYATNSIGTSYGFESSVILYINTPGPNVSDVDGNVYHSVKIGAQIWTLENLKTTKYNNGNSIGTTIPASLYISIANTPKYQWAPSYGDENMVATYGRLYTWYAVTDSRGICPTGWHLPSDAEWTTLTTFFGGESVEAGNKLKEAGTTHWQRPNTGATNSSGFTALPGGYRINSGTFNDEMGYWWSSTETDPGGAWYRGMSYALYSVVRGYSYDKAHGFSVRCVKD